MSVLLLSAAFLALLTAGGIWAALPLLAGTREPGRDSPDLKPQYSDAAFNVYPYGWKP
ncbi:hypothetical protein ACFVTE_06620 [Arthrobacter sp. NPDC058097]|uniref:hypothetical protein n=1 Tax=Arthrobacter sp. NPDC058097 TaxID=3346340 RepID=UPI0036DEE51D